MADEQLQTALERMDAAALETWIQQPGQRLGNLPERLRRARLLIKQWASQAELLRRDEFLKRVLAALRSADAADEVTTDIERIIEGGRLFELAYAELRGELERELPTPDARASAVWSFIELLGQTASRIRSDTSRMLQRGAIDPPAAHAIGEGGVPYQPDSTWGSAVEIVTGGLQMLGHAGKHFDHNSALVLPPRAEIAGLSPPASQRLGYLGAAWIGVEKAEERWRWWGGEVDLAPLTTPEGRVVQCVRYQHEVLHFEILNQIATDRLSRLLMNTTLTASDIARKIGIKGAWQASSLPLPPEKWLSAEEFVAAACLEVLLKVDATQETAEFGGLRLAEWLRGYSVLAELAKGASEHAVSIGRDALVDNLRRLGLPDQRADAFVCGVTFGRHSEDLFDCPLLSSHDTRLLILADIVQTWDLAKILVSQVRTAKQSVTSKGRGLENFVRERLAEAGIQARAIKFKEGDDEYEYDVVFVWNDVLFILECKNRGFPGNAPKRLHGLRQDLTDDLAQLRRLVAAAGTYPHQIERVVGQPWKRVVASVLNGLPWACGAVEDLAVYDASALVRFFQHGWALFDCPPGASPETAAAWKRILGSIWSDDRPSPSDLEREIRSPFQLRALRDEWVVHQPIVPISEELAFLRPVLTRKPPSPRRTLEALGARPSERELLVSAFELATGITLPDSEKY